MELLSNFTLVPLSTSSVTVSFSIKIILPCIPPAVTTLSPFFRLETKSDCFFLLFCSGLKIKKYATTTIAIGKNN